MGIIYFAQLAIYLWTTLESQQQTDIYHQKNTENERLRLTAMRRRPPVKKHKGNENYERRQDVIFDLTEAFVCANIPLEKIDNPKLHAFLNKHVINAGAIPTAGQLRRVAQDENCTTGKDV
ncbi:UNVERIFIED_CONTAM: hypothetical protein FKN15_060365 [Acipenser sinensis]